MSYTIFDRMCDAVNDALESELDREAIESIWESEIDPILDRFSDAEDLVWEQVFGVIANHGGG